MFTNVDGITYESLERNEGKEQRKKKKISTFVMFIIQLIYKLQCVLMTSCKLLWHTKVHIYAFQILGRTIGEDIKKNDDPVTNEVQNARWTIKTEPNRTENHSRINFIPNKVNSNFFISPKYQISIKRLHTYQSPVSCSFLLVVQSKWFIRRPSKRYTFSNWTLDYGDEWWIADALAQKRKGTHTIPACTAVERPT